MVIGFCNNNNDNDNTNNNDIDTINDINNTKTPETRSSRLPFTWDNLSGLGAAWNSLLEIGCLMGLWGFC